MQIVYIGNFKPTFSTENHIRRTLEDMGHQVLTLQEDEILASHMWRVSRWADLVLYTRTWKLLGDGMKLMHDFEISGIPTASYHLDLYMGISRERGLRGDPFWATKYVFTPDGDPESQRKFEALGINHIYMKPAVVRDECYLGNKTPELSHDVAFVGSYAYHPEWNYRPQLIDWLHDNYGDKFRRYGIPAKDQPDAFGVREQKLNDLYASTKIIVGDTLCVGFTHEGYWSDRVYETLGRGGFLIHPYIKGMEQEFEDKKHLVFYEYGNFQQLQELIQYYLKHDDERQAIQKAGHEFVKANATYHNRMETMLEVLAQHEPRINAKLKETTHEANAN